MSGKPPFIPKLEPEVTRPPPEIKLLEKPQPKTFSVRVGVDEEGYTNPLFTFGSFEVGEYNPIIPSKDDDRTPIWER
jgi:hypothetical protein